MEQIKQLLKQWLNAANELGEFNIRVNAVSGGPIDTDALKAFTNYEEVKAKLLNTLHK